MSFEEQLRGLFDASDVDGSGFLDERELHTLLDRMGVPPEAISTQVEHMFSLLRSNDRKMSFGQFLSVAESLVGRQEQARAGPAAEAAAVAAPQPIDAADVLSSSPKREYTTNERLTHSTVSKRVARLSEAKLSHLRSLFQAVDEDGSGSIGTTELLAILRDQQVMATSDKKRRTSALEDDDFLVCHADAVMATLDVSGDGTLDFDEFCVAMAPLFEDDGSVAKNTIWQAEVQFLSGELATARRDNARLQESLAELQSKVDLETAAVRADAERDVHRWEEANTQLTARIAELERTNARLMDKTERQDQAIISLEQAKATKAAAQADPAEHQATLSRYLDEIDHLHRKLDETKQMHSTAWAQHQLVQERERAAFEKFRAEAKQRDEANARLLANQIEEAQRQMDLNSIYYETQIRGLREELMACKAQERDMSDLLCELEKRVQESAHQSEPTSGGADSEQGVPLLFELSESFGAVVGQTPALTNVCTEILQQQQLEEAAAKNLENEAALLAKDRELESLRETLAKERSTIAQQSVELQTLQQSFASERSTQGQLESLQQTLTQERAAHAEQQTELQSLQQTLAQARAVHAQQQTELESLQHALTQERTAHAQRQSELQSLQQVLSQERAYHAEQLAESSSQVQQLKLLCSQHDASRLEQEQRTSAELSEARNALQSAAHAGLQLQARVSALEQELTEVKAAASVAQAKDADETERKREAVQLLYSQVQSENQALLAAKGAAEAELAGMTTREVEARLHADQLRARFEEDRKSLQAAQASIMEQQREAHAQIRELEARVVEMATQIADLNQQHQDTLQAHEHELNEVRLQLRNALDRESENAARVQALLQELDEHHKSADAMLLELSRSADDSQRQIARLQAEIEAAARDKAQREQLIAHHEARMQRARQKLEHIDAERELKIQRRFEALVEDLKAKGAAIGAREQEFERQRLVWQESMSSSDAHCTEQSMMITKLKDENTSLQEKLASQEALVAQSQLRLSEQAKLLDELREQLRLQQSLLSSNASDAQQHAMRFQQQCAEQSALIMELQSQLRERDDQLSAKSLDSQKQVTLLEDQCARQATLIGELQEQAAGHLQQLSQLEERIADLLAHQSEELAMAVTMKEKLRMQTNLLSASAERGDQAQQSLIQLKSHCDQQADSIAALQQEVLRYQERLQSQQEQLSSLQDQLVKAQQSQSMDLDSTRRELQQQHQEHLHTVDQQHQQAMLVLRQKLAELEARESEAQARITSLLTDLNQSQQALQTLRTEAALIDSQAKADIARLQTLCTQQASEIAVLTDRFSTAETSRLTQLSTSQVETLEQELTASRARESQLQLKVDALQQEVAEGQRKLRPVPAKSPAPVDTDQLQLATSELAVLQRRMERQEAHQREVLSREIAAVKKPLERKIAVLTQRETEAQTRIAGLVAELENARREPQARVLLADPSEHEHRVAQLQAELKAKDQELKTMHQQMDSLRQENVEHQTAIGSQQEQNEKASSWQARCQTATRELKTLRTVVSSLEQQVTSHSQREVELEAQCSQLHVSIHELREQLLAAEALAASAAAALSQSAKEISVNDGQLSVASATRMNSCASHVSSLDALEAIRLAAKRSSTTGFKAPPRNSFGSDSGMQDPKTKGDQHDSENEFRQLQLRLVELFTSLHKAMQAAADLGRPPTVALLRTDAYLLGPAYGPFQALQREALRFVSTEFNLFSYSEHLSAKLLKEEVTMSNFQGFMDLVALKLAEIAASDGLNPFLVKKFLEMLHSAYVSPATAGCLTEVANAIVNRTSMLEKQQRVIAQLERDLLAVSDKHVAASTPHTSLQRPTVSPITPASQQSTAQRPMRQSLGTRAASKPTSEVKNDARQAEDVTVKGGYSVSGQRVYPLESVSRKALPRIMADALWKALSPSTHRSDANSSDSSFRVHQPVPATPPSLRTADSWNDKIPAPHENASPEINWHLHAPLKNDLLYTVI